MAMFSRHPNKIRSRNPRRATKSTSSQRAVVRAIQQSSLKWYPGIRLSHPEDAWALSGEEAVVFLGPNPAKGTLFSEHPGMKKPQRLGVVKIHDIIQGPGGYMVLATRPGQLLSHVGGLGLNPAEPGIDDQEPATPGIDEQMPKAPPAGCCVDTDAMKVVCPDTQNPWHGQPVAEVEAITDQGMVVFWWVDAAGARHKYRLPLCEMPGEDECCYDAKEGVILCDDPNHPMHGQKADIVEELGQGYVYVCGQLDPASSALTCARLPLCPDRPPDCCYDAVSGAIVCETGAFPHGLVPELLKEGEDEQGKPYVVVMHPQLEGGNRTLLPLCPEEPPIECCFDVGTGTLRCPGDAKFDGLEVSLEHMTDVMPDGKIYAVVSHPELPGGTYRFPICDDGVPDDCCYDGQKKVLVCPGNPELDGLPAGVVTQFTGPDGQPWVSVAWEGGGARMPLCTPECPPEYCCVNLQTGLFVCPGEPDLNGQPADVADVQTDAQGYNFAVLSDGTRVPVCGKECPPPELCPKCPTCPPGMWMTPDKKCVPPPECEPPNGECPPGMWRDPDGICRMPPECPKYPPKRRPPPRDECGPYCWWGKRFCCEKCALGLPCAEDCGCDGKSHGKGKSHRGGRKRNPSARATSSGAVWYPAAYTNYFPAIKDASQPWVQLLKGKKTGVLRVPGPANDYKVKVYKIKKTKNGYKALVKGMQTSSGRALRAPRMTRKTCPPGQKVCEIIPGSETCIDDDAKCPGDTIGIPATPFVPDPPTDFQKCIADCLILGPEGDADIDPGCVTECLWDHLGRPGQPSRATKATFDQSFYSY